MKLTTMKTRRRSKKPTAILKIRGVSLLKRMKTTQLKGAIFNADGDSYTDTNKVWLTLQLKI